MLSLLIRIKLIFRTLPVGLAFMTVILFNALLYAQNEKADPFDIGTSDTTDGSGLRPESSVGESVGSGLRPESSVGSGLRPESSVGSGLRPESTEIQANFFKIKADVSPHEIRPGDSSLITVKFSIASGYYMYSDRTRITPGAVHGLTFGEMKKSEGIKKEDPYVGTVFMYKDHAEIQIPVTADKETENGKKIIPLTVAYQGCSQAVCFIPKEEHFTVELLVSASAAENDSAGSVSSVKLGQVSDPKLVQVSDLNQQPGENSFQKTADKFGFIGVLAAAFLWGFLASLTPCVYPMIPITVSVISSGSSGSTLRGFVLSLFYVLGLSLTYAVFGVVAAWSGGLFGEYTNHPAVRVIVAGIFVLLGLSMFDMLYIQMPSLISSKLGGYTGKGAVGVFFTGAAAGAVVGPCVGPMLVGLLVYIAALGSKFQGFLIMWIFALGMGMLFLLIGTFSGAATALPRAGAWMEKIKHFFGVLMLAAALYYLKPLMPENVFHLIVGIFFVGIAVFTGVFDSLSPDAAKRERIRKTAGIVFLALGIGYIIGFTLNEDIGSKENTAPRKTGIVWLKDEGSALSQAKEQKKPMIIDFTADWCPVCKRLEHETFSDPLTIEASKRFFCVRIDCTDTNDPEIRKLWKKYNIVGLPTIAFLDSHGNLKPEQSVTEFVKSEIFLKKMSQIQ